MTLTGLTRMGTTQLTGTVSSVTVSAAGVLT